jgi:hypothetical protein
LIHASLHQSQAEDTRIEIEIFLGWPGDGRHMVESFNLFHASTTMTQGLRGRYRK